MVMSLGARRKPSRSRIENWTAKILSIVRNKKIALAVVVGAVFLLQKKKAESQDECDYAQYVPVIHSSPLGEILM